jgi:hypothetical protein
MIKRDLASLDKFLAKVKDASRTGLKEVRIDTRDAIEMTTLIAQLLLDASRQQYTIVKQEPAKTQLDGGLFK